MKEYNPNFYRHCKFIAKPNTWFKEGTEAKFNADEDYLYTGGHEKDEHVGVFEGTFIVGSANGKEYLYDQGYKDEDEVIVREACGFDEFYISLDAVSTLNNILSDEIKNEEKI